jgi:hypothetical protein
MKIKLSRKLKQMASALLVVMVLGGILCLFVMYYLSLIEQQNMLSVRSQSWNIAIAVTEAGIEEGLQALNDARNNHTTLSTADGWIYDGRYYWRTNTNPELGGNWYTIRIDLSVPQSPEIVSRAYVDLPALAAATPQVFLATVGVNLNPTVITRAVRVRCADSAFFLAAMVAKHKIDLKGNGVMTDSFDSSSLWESYFGQYDPSVAGSEGDVASNDGVVSSISVQNANIYGHAYTGPDGTVTIGSQGYVGERSKYVAGTYEDGWVLHNANFTFPATTLPYTSGLPLGGPATVVTVTYNYTSTLTNSSVYPNPAPWSGVTPTYLTTPTTTSEYPAAGTYVGLVVTNYPGYSGNEKTYTYNLITGTNYTYALYQTNAVYTTNYYDHVLASGNYSADDLSGRTLVTGTAQLVLPNGLSMSGNDQITIATGASLKMFCGGSQCTVGGNGILNQSGYAQNMILECTDSVTSFSFNGNGEFIGVLVAPNAAMTMNGGGHSNTDFTGAVMANSIAMNGHFSFHYDEALKSLRNNPRLLITSWDEIP